MKFKETPEVYDLIKKNGKSILPVTTLDGKIIKQDDYPTLEEIEKALEGDKND